MFEVAGHGDVGAVQQTHGGLAGTDGGPAATVVIATRNRGAELCRTLERLTHLPERPPVIVVDNGSQDGTAATVRSRFPGTELIALRRNRGAWARNLGVLRARTPLIALADDDSWWAPGALAAAAAVLAASPRVGLLAARILVGPDRVPDEVNAVMAASPLPSDGLPGPRVMGFLGCGAVVRREAYLEVGGFSRLLFIGGEEQLLAYDLAAAGWAACYLPDIVAYHHPSASRQPATRRSPDARTRARVAWLRRPLRRALTE
ncbi:MAG: hypothetical protein QOG05_1020, partial [Streptosporangiaceae bacterium]|nr:hypothetical protein [Streptosporangiaceae bacterium]